jgi:hypothetical protein
MKALALILLTNFVFAFVPATRCRPARHAKRPAINGLTYSRARRILLAAGWRPLKTNSSATEARISYGNGPLFWGRGYTEVESCAVGGLAGCTFLFKDRFGNRLRVTTQGEEHPEVNAHARINNSRFVCD